MKNIFTYCTVDKSEKYVINLGEVISIFKNSSFNISIMYKNTCMNIDTKMMMEEDNFFDELFDAFIDYLKEQQTYHDRSNN
jgi:hypothetical protein